MVLEMCCWEECAKQKLLTLLCANCLALVGATLPINILMATALPQELAASSALEWQNLFEQASSHTFFLQGARPACDEHPNFLILGVVRAQYSFRRCSPKGCGILESCSRLCLAGTFVTPPPGLKSWDPASRATCREMLLSMFLVSRASQLVSLIRSSFPISPN